MLSSLCALMFLSRLRVLFPLLFLFLLSKNYISCLWRLFWSLTKNSSKRQKHTKLSSDRHILLFGSVCLQYVCLLSLSFRSSSRRQQRDDLVSAFVSSRVVAIGAKRLLVLAGKEVERLYSFCAPKKESSFLPPLRLLLCDLFFVITTYELYSRGLLGLLLSFFYCLLVVQTVESSSSGGVVPSC